jgi:hypothetical protein
MRNLMLAGVAGVIAVAIACSSSSPADDCGMLSACCAEVSPTLTAGCLAVVHGGLAAACTQALPAYSCAGASATSSCAALSVCCQGLVGTSATLCSTAAASGVSATCTAELSALESSGGCGSNMGTGPGTTGTGPGVGTGPGMTPPCGALGQPCCTDAMCTTAGLICSGNTCAQRPTNGTGMACTANGQCPSGICLPLGNGTDVCTSTCSDASSCVPGWTCAPLAGQTSNVCQCTPSAQGCDGRDDSCTGLVDSEPAADQSCAQKLAQGAVCQSGECTCGTSKTLCGSTCTDTQADGNNCGGCAGQGGQVCGDGSSCSAGVCVCPGGGAYCGSACTNTQTDDNNCGGCGHACGGGTSCSGGACACPSGRTSCADGCTDTMTDPNNCGVCGVRCGAPTTTCSGGKCVCPSGMTRCPNAGEPFCTDTQTDAENCGGCTNDCGALPNGDSALDPLECSGARCCLPSGTQCDQDSTGSENGLGSTASSWCCNGDPGCCANHGTATCLCP